MIKKILQHITSWGFGFYIGKNPWEDATARGALTKIVEKLSGESLSSLGREIRDIALKGLGR